jgi:hypothetical protein
MINSKVLEILASLNRKEFKEFKNFVDSPFHNKNRQVNVLLGELAKFYPAFEHKNLTKEYLFLKIFGRGKFKEWKIRNLLAELSKLADEFMIIAALNKRKNFKNSLLNFEFIDRNLSRHFEINLKSAGAELDKSPLRDSDYYFSKYVFSYQDLQNKRRKGTEFYDMYEDVKKLELVLEDYYTLELAKLYQPALSAKMNIRTKTDFKNYNFLNNYLEKNKESLKPASLVYYYYFRLCNNLNDENYYALKNSLHEKEMFFDELERNNFYILLHNFVLDKINNHKLDLWNEYQDILERMIEKKIGVNFYGKINPQLFRNMVKVYSKNKNYDKANDFVENHYNDISEEHRYTNYYYSKALLMFFKGEFEKSIETLSKVTYEDYLLKFLVYSLSLRNYYELGYIESCYAQLDTALQGIIKDKVAGESYKTNYINFFSYLRKILDIRVKENFKDIGLLKKALEKEVIVAAKEWLLEKMEELMKKH